MGDALRAVECVTAFVEDLAATKGFYAKVFGRKLVYEDAVSAVFAFDGLLINLLQIEEAPKLIEPVKVAGPSAGQRVMFTVRVPDVDESCKELAALGVALLNGPIDRPWGRRTAAFADPAGLVWELAQEIEK